MKLRQNNVDYVVTFLQIFINPRKIKMACSAIASHLYYAWHAKMRTIILLNRMYPIQIKMKNIAKDVKKLYQFLISQEIRAQKMGLIIIAATVKKSIIKNTGLGLQNPKFFPHPPERESGCFL